MLINLSGSDGLPTRTRLSLRTSFIPLQKRRGNTGRSSWCRAPTPTSWMWNVLVQLSSGAIGCYKITTAVGRALRVVLYVGCSTALCQPAGGRARLAENGVPLEGSSIRRTLNQDDRGTMQINTFWIQKCLLKLQFNSIILVEFVIPVFQKNIYSWQINMLNPFV